jgi:uncharacterized protein (TIGR02145 family)
MKKALLMAALAAAVVGGALGCGGKGGVKPAPPSVSTFTDSRDGQVYKIVQIGSQSWLAENLNYAADGSVCYDNKDANCSRYGRLYNFSTAKDACPAGYHLPNQDEWVTLFDYIVGESGDWYDDLYEVGKKLKSKTGWKDKGNGTNEYGFSILPGGDYDDDIEFCCAGYVGGLWSTTVYDHYPDRVWSLRLQATGTILNMTTADTTIFLSVRCVADNRKEAQK